MADISAIKLPSGTTYNIKDINALPLTGGSVTGPVSFGDSVSMDEATIGDLVVNGSASFTNNIQANTINGVVVGSSPKFTDTNTEVSTLTLAAGSTAGTTLTSGGKFTLTAGSKTVSFTMPTIPSVPSNIVNTITTTAGAHTAITSQKGNVSFNVPTKTSHLTNDSGFITSYTDEKLKIQAVSNNTYYPIVGANSTAASVRQYDSTGFSYSVFNGTTSSTGSSTLILGNNIAEGNANNKEGRIKLYSPKNGSAELYMKATSTSQRLICFPDKSGTVALTSDIPTVPSSTGSATTGITASTTATKTTLGTAFTIPNVTSAGSASSWVFEEITIPNVTSAGSASTWTFEEKTIPNVTSAGSASTWAFTSKTVVTGVTFAMDTTDIKKLKITTSTDTVYSKSSGSNGTAPTLGTAIKVQSKSGGGNGTAPTLGTAIKVQSKKSGANGSAPTLGTAFTVPNVTGNTSATVSITDNGHTHTI